MKKIAFLFAIILVFSLTACANTGSETTTTAAEEPEVFVTSEIIKNGVSEYVIVHDGTLGTYATEIKNMISKVYGVQIEVKTAKQSAEDGYEIVLGNCREIAEKTCNKLTGEFDFALKVEEKKLVLCAKDKLSYSYLCEYLKDSVFVQSADASLTLDSEDNIIYSKSSLAEKNYIDYCQEKGKYFSLDELFAFAEFKNADTTLPYRIYVPFNYSAEKKYPLLVSLHGAGFRGNDNITQLKFIDTLLKNPEMPLDEAIIIFPQCPENNKWVDTDWAAGSYSLDKTPESNELKALVELIGQLQQSYSVDAKRIYACGFSMGGYGTWNLLMNHPDLFCAGVAMCGAADPSKANVLVNTPVWAIHGALDPTVPVSGSREMVDAIRSAGGQKIQYTELADAQHDVWTYTYGSSEIFGWLFQQVKE